MPRLYEIVSKESVESLRPFLTEALEAIGLDGLEAERKEDNLYTFTSKNWNLQVGPYEAGPLWASVVHSQILKHARFDPAAPDPFTHRASKISIRKLIAGEILPQLLGGTSETRRNQSTRFASELMRILWSNGLIKSIPGSNDLWVRGTSEDPVYSTERKTGANKAAKLYRMPRRDAERVEKRIHEEADKPVAVHYTVPELPTEATPQAILNWARQFKKTFDKLNARYEQLTKEYVAVRDKIDKLEKLENTKEWQETLQGLADVIKTDATKN